MQVWAINKVLKSWINKLIISKDLPNYDSHVLTLIQLCSSESEMLLGFQICGGKGGLAIMLWAWFAKELLKLLRQALDEKIIFKVYLKKEGIIVIFMKVFSTFPLTFFTSVSFDQTLRTHFTVYVSFYLSFNILKQKLTWYTVYDKIELWTVSKRLQNKICIEKTLWYIRFCHWTFLLWEIVVLDIFAVGDCATGLFCCGRFWCWTF